LALDFNQGTEEIEIADTKMVPEFGGGGTTITAIMVTVAILGFIAIGDKEMALE
jgi:hypothetical protein